MQSGGRVVLSLKYVVSSSTSSRSQLRLQRRLVDMMAAVTEREFVYRWLFAYFVLLFCLPALLVLLFVLLYFTALFVVLKVFVDFLV